MKQTLGLLLFILVGTHVNAEGVHYSHPDHLGSLQLVTDQTGKVIDSLSYTPFGEIFNVPHSTSHASSFQYTGQEFDSESDLSYYGARYYDSTLARFVSVDRVQNNLPYAYVNNNPIRFIDPKGEDEDEPGVTASPNPTPEPVPSPTPLGPDDYIWVLLPGKEEPVRLDTWRSLRYFVGNLSRGDLSWREKVPLDEDDLFPSLFSELIRLENSFRAEYYEPPLTEEQIGSLSAVRWDMAYVEEAGIGGTYDYSLNRITIAAFPMIFFKGKLQDFRRVELPEISRLELSVMAHEFEHAVQDVDNRVCSEEECQNRADKFGHYFVSYQNIFDFPTK